MKAELELLKIIFENVEFSSSSDEG